MFKSFNKIIYILKVLTLFSFCNKKIGDGLDISFWEDIWIVDMSFKTMFYRLYLLELDKQVFRWPKNLCKLADLFFFWFPMAGDLLLILGRWWNIAIHTLTYMLDWFRWFCSIMISKVHRVIGSLISYLMVAYLAIS